jgi:hypothetical protein
MNIVSKVRTVSKITEVVEKELSKVDIPESVVSKVDFQKADVSVHEVTRLNNQLKATIETAKEPFLKEIKKIDTETKGVRDAIAEGIESIKDLMKKYFTRYPETKLEAGTVMAVVKAVEITDISKVPEEYYDVDKTKILKALQDGVKVPGAKLVEEYQIRITEKKY